MLILSVLSSMILALILLVVIDDKTSVKVPFLHNKRFMVSVFIKAAYKSDFAVSTIKCAKKLKTLVISNICRLTE